MLANNNKYRIRICIYNNQFKTIVLSFFQVYSKSCTRKHLLTLLHKVTDHLNASVADIIMLLLSRFGGVRALSSFRRAPVSLSSVQPASLTIAERILYSPEFFDQPQINRQVKQKVRCEYCNR